jgi:DNA replication initiation complex subunit (GINS family)
MLMYNDLYEVLRKEKNNDQLQALPENFVSDFSVYLKEKRKEFSSFGEDMFAEDILREKKQFENALSLFKELMLRRKKKILSLVFVAAETGVMKKDYTDMLSFEKDLFDKLVLGVSDSEKTLSDMLNGGKERVGNKMVVMSEDVEEFIDMAGKVVGPYKEGEVVGLDVKVADILVSGGKAKLVDEK